MKQRFRTFQRGNGIWYCHDNDTGRQESLRTLREADADCIVQAKNESLRQPQINIQIAKAYLVAGDPAFASRTWQLVMDEAGRPKNGVTKERWGRAMRETPFDLIRNLPLIETRPENFLKALSTGTVSTIIFLRRLHNFALDLGWLPTPILPKKQWPKIVFKQKRAVTLGEHLKIVAGESNPEWCSYYWMLWHLGGSQTDIAGLAGENIDRHNRVISYRRGKTGSPVQLHFRNDIAQVLETLPPGGLLFPNIARMRETDRAIAFARRCRLVGVAGVSLHCYRYAWAERAKTAGYPERFAQEALGHKSKAVHHAYASHAHVQLPALEDFEKARAESRNDPNENPVFRPNGRRREIQTASRVRRLSRQARFAPYARPQLTGVWRSLVKLSCNCV